MNMLPILMMMNTTTHLLQQQSMNSTLHHPLPPQSEEKEEGDTIDATEYTAPEAYIPKHAKKEDLEKERVSM